MLDIIIDCQKAKPNTYRIQFLHLNLWLEWQFSMYSQSREIQSRTLIDKLLNARIIHRAAVFPFMNCIVNVCKHNQ